MSILQKLRQAAFFTFRNPVVVFEKKEDLIKYLTASRGYEENIAWVEKDFQAVDLKNPVPQGYEKGMWLWLKSEKEFKDLYKQGLIAKVKVILNSDPHKMKLLIQHKSGKKEIL